jgi:uncharacterized protein (TIGR03435 family)
MHAHRRIPECPSYSGRATVGTIVGLLLVVLLCAGRGTAQHSYSFEVASVKRCVRPSNTGGPLVEGLLVGGPGTSRPGELRGIRVTLLVLIREAYDVHPDQVSGPGWLEGDGFDVAAKIPPAATRPQLRLMLQSLLEERFKLVLHREPREFPVYELTVGSGGARMSPTAYPAGVPLRPGEIFFPPKWGDDGYPLIPSGRAGNQCAGKSGISFCTYQSSTISDLMKVLEIYLGRGGLSGYSPARMIDRSGLNGRYDFKFAYAGALELGGAFEPPNKGFSATADTVRPMEDQAGGTGLIEALEKQLGLKLAKTKGMFDVLVIDHAERVPVEN